MNESYTSNIFFMSETVFVWSLCILGMISIGYLPNIIHKKQQIHSHPRQHSHSHTHEPFIESQPSSESLPAESFKLTVKKIKNPVIIAQNTRRDVLFEPLNFQCSDRPKTFANLCKTFLIYYDFFNDFTNKYSVVGFTMDVNLRNYISKQDNNKKLLECIKALHFIQFHTEPCIIKANNLCLKPEAEIFKSLQCQNQNFNDIERIVNELNNNYNIPVQNIQDFLQFIIDMGIAFSDVLENEKDQPVSFHTICLMLAVMPEPTKTNGLLIKSKSNTNTFDLFFARIWGDDEYQDAIEIDSQLVRKWMNFGNLYEKKYKGDEDINQAMIDFVIRMNKYLKP